MAGPADLLVEGDDDFLPQEGDEVRLVVGQGVALGDLEDGVHEDLGGGPLVQRVVASDHRQEVPDCVGAGVQLNILGTIEYFLSIARNIRDIYHTSVKLLLFHPLYIRRS